MIGWLGGLTKIAASVVIAEDVYFGLTATPNPRVERWLETFLGPFA